MRRDYSQRTFDLRGAFLSAGMSGLRGADGYPHLIDRRKSLGLRHYYTKFFPPSQGKFLFFQRVCFSRPISLYWRSLSDRACSRVEDCQQQSSFCITRQNPSNLE